MNRILITTALALGLAAPAFASDQLARNLGVEPGAYSVAELATIKQAVEKSSNEGRVFVGADSVAFVADSNAGAAQLAAALGVDGGQYSVAELATLKQAVEKSSNEGTVYFGNEVAFTATGGAGQLAANLGLDPADYTVAELAQIKQAIEKSSNEGRVFID